MHRIRRLFYDLRVSPGSGVSAFAVRQRVEALTADAVLPALDAVFSRIAPLDEIWRIDRIEVDLGRIDPNQLDRVLPERIGGEVGEALAASAAVVIPAGSRRGSTRPDAGMQDRARPEQDGAMAMSRSGFMEECLAAFIETGSLPWWGGEIAAAHPEQVMAEWLDLSPESARKLMPFVVSSPVTRRRFARQFGESARVRFLKQILPERIGAIRDWISIVARTLEDARKPGPADVKPDEAAWTLLLEALARSDPEKAPAQTLIEAVARHLGMPAADIEVLRRIREAAAHIPASDAALVRQVIQATGIQPPAASRSHIPGDTGPGSAPETPDTAPARPGASPWPWRRPKAAEPITTVYIDNAGLILVWPYLPRFFEALKLTGGSGFQDPAAHQRAVHLVQYLATGASGAPEHRLPLCKILCGLALDEPLTAEFTPTPDEIREAGDLLTAIIGHWSALGATSIAGFQTAFLQREGRLDTGDDSLRLTVERRGYDVLLERLPWGISLIRLSWMAGPLSVEW